MSGVGRFLGTTALRNIDGHSPIQRHPPVVGTPLPDSQAWASACRLPEESQLCALLPLPVAQPVDGVLSPSSTDPRPLRPVGATEFVGQPPRTTRRAKRQVRPVRVVETSVGDLPVLTLQDPSDVQWAVVFDCRPPLLLVSLDLSGIGLLSALPPAASASVGVPPRDHGLSISGGLSWSSHSLRLLHLRTPELTWRTSCRRRMGCRPLILHVVSWFLVPRLRSLIWS